MAFIIILLLTLTAFHHCGCFFDDKHAEILHKFHGKPRDLTVIDDDKLSLEEMLEFYDREDEQQKKDAMEHAVKILKVEVSDLRAHLRYVTEKTLELVNGLILTLAKQKTGEKLNCPTYEVRSKLSHDGYFDSTFNKEWDFNVLDENGQPKNYEYKWNLREGDGKIVKIVLDKDAGKKLEIPINEQVQGNESSRVLSIDPVHYNKQNFQKKMSHFKELAQKETSPPGTPRNGVSSPLRKSPSKNDGGHSPHDQSKIPAIPVAPQPIAVH